MQKEEVKMSRPRSNMGGGRRVVYGGGRCMEEAFRDWEPV